MTCEPRSSIWTIRSSCCDCLAAFGQCTIIALQQACLHALTTDCVCASYTLAAGWFDKSNDGDRDHSLLGSAVRFDATNDKAQGAMPGAAAVAQDDDDDDWEVGVTSWHCL